MEAEVLISAVCQTCRAESLRPAGAALDRRSCLRCREPFPARNPIQIGPADWVVRDDPDLLRQAVELLGPYPSARKGRLLTCAIGVRGFPDCDDPQFRRAVETGVAFAEGWCDAAARKRIEAELIQLPADRREIPEWLAVAWMCVADKPVGLRAGYQAVNSGAVCDCYREVLPNPLARPEVQAAWLTPSVRRLAGEVAYGWAFDRLPALADALEGGGCNDDRLLDHCRQAGPHAAGCWIVDLLVGRE